MLKGKKVYQNNNLAQRILILPFTIKSEAINFIVNK
jgi:hypothetical protein